MRAFPGRTLQRAAIFRVREKALMQVSLGWVAEGGGAAMKLADSLTICKVLAATDTTAYNGAIGHIAFDDRDDLKGGAITFGDFKDKKIVPTAVKT